MRSHLRNVKSGFIRGVSVSLVRVPLRYTHAT